LRPRPSPHRLPPSPARAERLQKLLAAAGLGSRREIETWVAAGRIAVNGKVAKLGDRATASDRVELDGKALRLSLEPREPRILLYHKPVGELVTRHDPQGRATVFHRLPPAPGSQWVAVGRLDINSSGLLLFTDSGELANALMHPRNEVEREYLVRVYGEVSREQNRKLLSGVILDDGVAAFKSIAFAKGDHQNRWYRVVLREGRKREVRRLFEALGHPVSRLVRTRYGPVELPKGLTPGRWIELERPAAERLMEIVRGRKSC